MSATAKAAIAVAGARLVIRYRPHWPPWARLVPVAAVWLPVATAFAGTSVAVAALARKRRRVRTENEQAAADVVTLAELMSLGLAAGLDARTALVRAAVPVAPPLAAGVNATIRHGHIGGLAHALTGATGIGSDLFTIVAGAVETGAPIGAALEAFVDSQRDKRRAAELAAARRLPVKLLFPLALLILPGFMVLTIGPAVLTAADSLGL